MTPLGRLRKAMKLLNAIEEWEDRDEHGLPDDVLAWLQTANGLIAVTARDVQEIQRRERATPPAPEEKAFDYNSERPCGCNYVRGEQIFACPEHRVTGASGAEAPTMKSDE